MSENLSWQDYLDEYKLVVIGPLWLKQITRIVKNQCKRRNPGDFGITNWENEIDDLVNEVVSQRLVGLNQIHYICEVATDIDHAMGLLHNEVTFTFAKLRTNELFHSIRNRLLEEMRILGWQSGDSNLSNGSNHEIEKRVLRVLFALPRMPNRGESRQSPLISTPNLARAASSILDIDASMPLELINRCLREFLTKISSSISQLSVGASSDDFDEYSLETEAVSENSTIEVSNSELENMAEEILEGFEAIEIECIAGIALKESQSVIGERIGLTRQTTSLKMKESIDKLQNRVAELNLDVNEQDQLVHLFFSKLSLKRIEWKS